MHLGGLRTETVTKNVRRKTVYSILSFVGYIDRKGATPHTSVGGQIIRHTRMRQLGFGLVIFLVSSCGDKVERERLPGRYVFTHWTKDTIDIRMDGTYRHFTFINGKKLENSGTWKLNSIGNEIQFEDFSFLTDSLPSGNWFSRIRVDGKEIHLMYAADINAYYNKVGQLDSLK